MITVLMLLEPPVDTFLLNFVSFLIHRDRSQVLINVLSGGVYADNVTASTVAGQRFFREITR